jgi:hypothetical protein
VTFANPLRLGRDARELPAGTYRIDTLGRVQGSFDPVAVTSAVELVVEEHGGSSSRMISPADLAAALARDFARSPPPTRRRGATLGPPGAEFRLN